MENKYWFCSRESSDDAITNFFFCIYVGMHMITSSTGTLNCLPGKQHKIEIVPPIFYYICLLLDLLFDSSSTVT